MTWIVSIDRIRYGVMENRPDAGTETGQSPVYQIRIKGQLGPQWTNWFDGMRVTPEENGDTLVTGPVLDQAALFGLLRKVRDLGMPLLSVARVKLDHADSSDVR
jgi:hypothetical protein